MLIDLQLVTPYLLVVLAGGIGALGWYFRTVGSKLADVAVKLATLIEHNVNADLNAGINVADMKKQHDEIIELKVATAELDTKFKGIEHQLDLLFTARN